MSDGTRGHGHGHGHGLDIRLLGSVEFRADGQRRHVPGLRQRRLLALLSLSPGRLLTADGLVDALWGDEPPDTARRQVHNAIAALRRELPPLRDVLLSDGSGYRLDLPADRIDAHRFTHSTEAARADAAAGDRDGAVRGLREALGMWRGPALAGLTGRLLEAAAARLDEQRLDTHELLMELRLARGEAAALVPELAALFDAHPLREAFAAQLMLALYRSGRQPQALEVYERTRSTLVEELGVDPGPELRELHGRVLRGEAGLATPVDTDRYGGHGPTQRRGQQQGQQQAAELEESQGEQGQGQGQGREAAVPGPVVPELPPQPQPQPEREPAREPEREPARGATAEPIDTLPYDVADFTGRHAEVEAVTKLLAPPAAEAGRRGPGGLPVTALDGMAGVGKTALAVRVAHLVAEHFPDGRLFVDLHGYSPDRGPLSPAVTLDLLLRQLGVPPEQVPERDQERVALWRSVVAGRRLLIVLDNAADEAQVRPLLPGTATAAVLITSRRRLAGLEGARSLSLNVLRYAEAVELFLQVSRGAGVVGAAGAAGAAGGTAGAGVAEAAELQKLRELRHVDEVVALCGRLPLAIRIAGSRLRHRPAWTVAHLAHRLRDERRRLAELTAGDRDVRAAFAVSHQQLPPAEQLLFRRLGLHPGPDLDAYDAAALLDAPVMEAERLLESLSAAHLLSEHSAGRYHFHDLLGSYARALADAEESAAEQAEAARRLTEYYLLLGDAVERMVDPSRPFLTLDISRRAELPPLHTIADTKATMAYGHRVFLAAIEHAHAHGLHREAAQLAELMSSCLLRHGYVEEALTGCEIGLRAARAVGDTTVECAVHRGMGYAYVSVGRLSEALRAFRAGLAIERATGDELGAARTLLQMSGAHYRLGEYRAAVETLEPLVELMRRVGSSRDVAVSLGNLAIAYTQLGDYDLAIDACLETMELEPHSHRTRVLGLFNLGWARSRKGQLTQAEEHLREALKLNSEAGSAEYEARGRAHLADCLLRQGRAGDALAECRAALTLVEGIDSPDVRSLALAVLGDIHFAKGDIAASRACFDQALRTTEGLGLCFRRVVAHEGRGRVAAVQGDAELARHHLREALRLAEGCGVPAAKDIRRQLEELGDSGGVDEAGQKPQSGQAASLHRTMTEK